MDSHSVDVLFTKASGLLGAIVSLRFVKGNGWMDKATMVIGGWSASYYIAPYLAQRYVAPEGAMGFGVGLVAMAVCGLGFEMVQSAPVADFWQRLLKRVGL